MAREIRIETQEGGKGRTFQAVCLATVEADTLWEGGMADTDAMRPVWAMFAGSEQQLKPFAVNLLSGRKGLFTKDGTGYSRKKEERLDILKSAKFQSTWQKEAEGSVATVYLPDIFQMDPGMVDPKGALFIVMPSVAWTQAQKIEAGPIVRHVHKLLPEKLRKGEVALSLEFLASLVPMAFLFCAYLDRRTRCPLVSDGRFYLQLLIACLGNGLASWPDANEHAYYALPFGTNNSAFRGFLTRGTADVGLARPIAFKADHTILETMLAEQVSIFFETTRRK